MDQNSAKFLSFHAPKILKTFAVTYGPWKHYKESPRSLASFSFVCLHIVILLFFSFVAVDCLLFVCFFWLVVVSLLLATAVRENDHLKHNLLWFGREWGVLFVSTQHLKNLTTLVAGVISDK